ncbi:MAG TPA: heme-binding protein [Candidatus Binataceae bacterium]|nr:heme-binding protein [Candidatus Binataceae bacterium]
MKHVGIAATLAVLGIFANYGLAGAQSITAAFVPGPIEAACARAAAKESSAVRGPGKTTKMWCAVVDREGKALAINATDTGGTPQAPLGSDAWRGSIEIALAKAYSAVAFSSNDQALDTFDLGLATRPDGPGLTGPGDIGHDDGVASLWGIGNSNPFRSVNGAGLGSDDIVGRYHHGIITFAGGQPVYTKTGAGCHGGKLVGAVGVSGDGVDQDDSVAMAAVQNGGYCLTP